MPNIIEGSLVSKGKNYGIVIARFNDFISSKLLEGAIDALTRHGVQDHEVTVAWVPGSWEIPVVARKMAESGKFSAVIALGTVIRGGTPHFDYIASEVSKGVAQIAMQTGVPVLFGVLTTDTIEQAIERAGAKNGNKGFDAAQAAIEMANLMDQL
jgi:6,7-dimethyl-8-ribityllumazine synthase